VFNLHNCLTFNVAANAAVFFRYLSILLLESLTDMMTPNFGSQK